MSLDYTLIIKQSLVFPPNQQLMKLLGCIGAGSFGKVFKLELEGDLYAIKKIPLDFDSEDDSQEMETLRNEAFLLSQCVYHPNVVRCYSSFRKGDDFFIVMEYVGHSSLNDISLPLGNQRQVVSLVIQLAMGIKHLKNNKIIHRDIKPSNILISDKGILKIADFGISKQLNETALARTCLGTPFYAAPEIIEKQHYDYSVDIWSFGVLLYECIHGYLPFVGNDLSELRKKIRYVSPDIREDIHEDLKIILKGCLTKHPQNRMSIEQILNVPLVRKQMKEDIRRFIPYF